MRLILEPGRSERNYWHDLWRYRGLLGTLAWRDLAVRYKQTLIGVVWAVLRPLLAVLVFTFIFGDVAGLKDPGGAPYALVVFAGLLPWSFFASALAEASNSVVANANLIGKVYFPRMIVPAATVAVALADFLIGLMLLAGMMAWFGHAPTWRILLLPLFTMLTFFASLGPALWIASLNVRYRDFRHVIPFIIQFGIYLSPVGFPDSVIPEKWRMLWSLNPLVGIIEGFRWCILGTGEALDARALAASCAVTATLLWIGIRRFRATEKSFADLI